jgi:putative intracellular protease/amidase
MKLACLLADGFEDIEALGTSAILRRAGIEVDFFSVHNHYHVTGAYGTTVTNIKQLKDMYVDDYDGLFIPGGKAAFKIRDEQPVKDIAISFFKKDKWMLAICAAPTVFGMLGIMDGLKYTSYPGTEDNMGKAKRMDQKSVRDGRFITGRSAGSVYDFAFEVVKALKGQEALEALKKSLAY